MFGRGLDGCLWPIASFRRRAAIRSLSRRSDVDMAIERKPDPKDDRGKITLSGKFLPFKDEGATGNAMAYGVKEEWPQ